MPISSFPLSIKLCDLIGIVLLLLFLGCTTSSLPEPITDVPSDEAPAWSPDGSRIAYYHYNPDAGDTEYPTGLYVLNLERGERFLVIEGPAFNPDWSPGGQWLTFNSGDIFIIRPDGSDLQQVTNVGSAFFPAWSPDGKRIAFDTPHRDESGANLIWLINPDGTELSDISMHGTGEWRDPDWSPDGEYMVHLRFLDGTFGEEVFIMDSLGSNAQRLTQNSENDRAPVWSPNGEWIAWSVLYEGKEWGLWIMRSDGSNQKELLRINTDNLINFLSK